MKGIKFDKTESFIHFMCACFTKEELDKLCANGMKALYDICQNNEETNAIDLMIKVKTLYQGFIAGQDLERLKHHGVNERLSYQIFTITNHLHDTIASLRKDSGELITMATMLKQIK